MRIARLLCAASTAAVVLTASADAQVRRTAATGRDAAERLRSAVESSGTRTADAYNRGEIEGFIRPYAEEIWVFPPNAEPFQGREASLQFFTRSYAQGARNLKLMTTGLDRSGDMAYETGTYTVDYPTPGGAAGATSRDYGKYVHVWKRGGDGAWQIHLSTWNSNLPAAPMAR